MPIEQSREADHLDAVVSKASAGDRGAESAMLAALRPGVLAVLRFGAFHRWIDAEDLTQETLRIVVERVRAQTIDDPRKVYAFAAATARNLALNAARKTLREQTVVDSSLIDELALDLQVEQSDLNEHDDRRLAQAVESLLAELPTERDRQLLTRFYLDGIEKTALCRDFGLTPKHFDRLLMRARTRLRAFIDRRMQPAAISQSLASMISETGMLPHVESKYVPAAGILSESSQLALGHDLTDVASAPKSKSRRSASGKRTRHMGALSGRRVTADPRRELLDTAVLTTIDRVSAIPQAEVPDLLAKIRKSGNPKALILDEVLTHDIPSRNQAALERAFERGERSKAEILAQPDMLTGEKLAKLLGMSRATVDLRRQQEKLLAVDFGAKRGVRYPSWQAEILQEPGKRKIFEQSLIKLSKLSSWSRYRFFVTPSATLGGATPARRFAEVGYETIVEAASAWAEDDENAATGVQIAVKR